jgi:hypothetical protein
MKRRATIVAGGLALLLSAVALGMQVEAASALAGRDGVISFTTQQGIEVSNVDGSNAHLLIPGGRDAAWSPRGNLVAYVDGNSVLWVARADGSHPRRIGLRDEEGLRPAWSPDGRLSYFNGAHVVIVDGDGSHRRVLDVANQVGQAVQIFAGPSWTSDGRLVLVLSSSTGVAPYIARGDGSHLRELTLSGGEVPSGLIDSYGWRFSSSGVVGYVDAPLDNQISVQLDRLSAGHLFEPAGGSDVELASRDLVAFSPSGGEVLLARGGELSIWSVDPDTLAIAPASGGFTVADNVSSIDWQPRCTINGTPGNDVLVGTPGVDVICGGGGNDTIKGFGGNDVIFGGPGNDNIYGGGGNDVLVGGIGQDTIHACTGNDLVNSRDHQANDAIHGQGLDTYITNLGDSITRCP